MKSVTILFFLAISISSFSQEAVIRGTIHLSGGIYQPISINNDTIIKVYKKLVSDTLNRNKWEAAWQAISSNQNYSSWTREEGPFEVSARPTDTLSFYALFYEEKKYLAADLLKMDCIDIVLEHEPCEVYVPCETRTPKNIYVFVGEKLKVGYSTTTYCDTMPDLSRDAEYRLLQNVYGVLPKDTIHFTSYVHLQKPPGFDDSKYAMLFVGDYCGKLLFLRSCFFNVYKTKDGRWAAPYSVNNYQLPDSIIGIKPHIIEFEEEVEMKTYYLMEEDLNNMYPAPYYKRENGKIIAVYGNYVDELLEIKKQTELKSRGIYLK